MSERRTCITCSQTGTIGPGPITFVTEEGATTVIVRRVPALVCKSCGEEYINGETARQIETIVKAAVQAGTEIAISEYRAAA